MNLAPAALRKEGSGFDLPISLAVLGATRQFPPERLAEHAAVGELGLDGRIRPVSGTLAVAEGARRAGLKRVVCAAESAGEAALAGIEPVPVTSLAEAVAYLRGEIDVPSFEPVPGDLNGDGAPDLADVRGQERARRALEIAAVGSHNLLLMGPPGTGKTMLARRLPGIRPALTQAEALEVTRIHSVAGLPPPGRSLVSVPPFRSPHHGASAPAIVGGGPSPRPGEVSLAHGDVASPERVIVDFMNVLIDDSLDGVDWIRAKADLAADRFDNGRTADALRRSFEQSQHVAIARDGDRVVGMARLLSDGVCNAYLLDVWTASAYRRKGIASAMVDRLLAEVPGQHVGLQTDDAQPFYESLGFELQPEFWSRVIGTWLDNDANR